MDNPPDATITTSTAVNVDSGEGRDDGVISEPSRLVANILWLVLVLTCSLVALASAAALLLDFLSPSQQVGGSKETILLLFSTAFNALVALFVSRPGTR